MKKNVDWNYLNRFFKNFPLLILLFTSAYAAVPSRITYQGRLSKSGVGAAGRHVITVQFIDKEGNDLTASQTFHVDIPTSGDFSLDIERIPPDADWINGLPKMRVIVGGETLTPDQSFSATPYALVARNVENLDTSKVKLAGSTTGSLLSSWQSPDDPTRINSKSVLGPIEVTTNHGAEHGLLGKDKIPAGTLSPSQIMDTALVLTSSVTQTIQPTEPVVPLVVKGQKNTGPNSTNMFEVWDNAAIPSKQFHIQDFGTAFFKGNVGIGTESPTQKLRVNGGNQVSLFGSQSGDHHNGTVLALETTGDSTINGPRLGFLKSNVKSWAIGIQPAAGNNNFSIWEDGDSETPGTERFTIAPGGNVGIGAPASGEALDVHGTVKLGILRALTPTHWGWSSTYPVVVLGPTSGVGTVSIGYDPSGNPSGSFSGDGREVLFRNGAKFVTPNSANKDFYTNHFVLKDGNVGINKAEPTKTLDVVGDANISGKITSSAIGINNPSPTKALDVVGDTNITGKVGINNPAPTKALDVVGDVNITGTITGATFGFGGMYSETDNPNKKYVTNNPLTGSNSCPSADYKAYMCNWARDPETYNIRLYICVHK